MSGGKQTNQEASTVVQLKDSDGLHPINNSSETGSQIQLDLRIAYGFFVLFFFFLNNTDPCRPDSGAAKIEMMLLSRLVSYCVLLIKMRKFHVPQRQDWSEEFQYPRIAKSHSYIVCTSSSLFFKGGISVRLSRLHGHDLVMGNLRERVSGGGVLTPFISSHWAAVVGGW